jgi:hypothetical protein
VNRGLERGYGQYESTSFSYPTTVNRGLERGYGAYEPVGVSYPTTVNRGLERGYITELEGPFLRYPLPIGVVCVGITGQISFTLGTVLPATIDLTTLVVTIDYLLGSLPGPITVYDGGAGGFQPGYSGSVTDVSTPLENLQAVVIAADAGLQPQEIIRVQVTVDDNTAVPMYPPEQWEFCTTGIPVPEPIIIPGSDTIRGGVEAILAVEDTNLYDLTEDATLKGATLPGGWTTATTGTGSITPTVGGVVLATGGAPYSSATITNGTVFEHFDIVLDVELLGPGGARENLTVGELKFVMGSDLFRIVLDLDSQGLLVRSDMTAVGHNESGHAVRVTAPSRFSLQLVRRGAHVWAFYGTREDGVIEPLDNQRLLLNTERFTTGTGQVSFGIANSTRQVNVRTRISNFTVRSHSTVAGRLLESKVVRFKRVVGNIPAAELAEFGDAAIAVFGLFGETEDSDGFTYTLPAQRTVGQETNRRLLLVQDESIKDGD